MLVKWSIARRLSLFICEILPISCVILLMILTLGYGTLGLQVTNQQQQQLAQASDKQHQQQLQQQVVAIQQAQQAQQQQQQHQQQQAPTNPSTNGKSVKSNHRLVNKIKDARHRRRHRHNRRRNHHHLANNERPIPSAGQAAAFAAMAAAVAEPTVQSASSTALMALESIVEEVARAGAQLPLVAANALQSHNQQQQTSASSSPHQQQVTQQQQATGSSPAISGSSVLLDNSSSPTSSILQTSSAAASSSSVATAPTQAPISSGQQQQPSGVLTQQQQQHQQVPQQQATSNTHVTRGPLHNTRGFLLTTTLSKIYNLLNVTEFALEMRDGISSRASCVACNAVVGLFLSPLYSKEVFSAAIRTVCVSFRIQSSRVCQGLVESFQDDFEYIRKNTKLTRDEVCGVVFGVDCARRQTYNLFWTVPIPELPITSPHHPNNQQQQQQQHQSKGGEQPKGIKATSSPSSSSSSSTTINLPLDEHSLTNMDDAPDLFEYRKSSIAMAASSVPGGVAMTSTSQQQETNKQQQSNVDSSDEQKLQDVGKEQQSNGMAIQASTSRQVQKASKMLKRPQYIFDDEHHGGQSDSLQSDASDRSRSSHQQQQQQQRQQQQQQQQVSQFVHITDIHIDPYYEPGALNECNEPLCCRATSGPVAAGDKRRQAGRWGDYGNCDVPVRTLVNALERIRAQHSNAEYWLWTGDISPHDIWNITKEEAANHVRLVTKLVREYSNGLPVFPVIGNHEAHPVNSFSPPEIKGKFSMSWLYDLLADEWSDWLPEDALKMLRIGGFYKLQVRKGFRIIALNTNYCARLNPWSFYDPVDPANQLKWLVDELLEAELNQDKVHIIGHVPPDNRECTQAWLFNFINIVDRFRDTIEAQFYGHTHRDEWRVIYSLVRPDEPIGVQFIGPSITPFTENNPAYRIYHQNKQGHILDSETYYFNLTEANETPSSEPRWRYSYSTREHLNMTQGSTTNQWHSYLQKLHDDDELFDVFYKNFYRYSDVKSGQVCRNKCKYQLLSDLRLSHPYKTKPKPFLANRKTSNHHRDRHDHHHHHRRLRSHQE